MDGVLVNQTGRARFDLMGWRHDGRLLWDAIKAYRPTLLSQLMADIYEISRPEKLAWAARELGAEVPVIVVRAEQGKHPHSGPGCVLIDDSAKHRATWEAAGGIFIWHRSAVQSIADLEVLRGNR